jgi:hypothetical protein
MNDIERYRFDLHGYLVIDDVLSAAEVAELNRLIDAQNLPEPSLERRRALAGISGGDNHFAICWIIPACCPISK